MDYITNTLGNLLHQTAFFNLTWGNYLMIAITLNTFPAAPAFTSMLPAPPAGFAAFGAAFGIAFGAAAVAVGDAVESGAVLATLN